MLEWIVNSQNDSMAVFRWFCKINIQEEDTMPQNTGFCNKQKVSLIEGKTNFRPFRGYRRWWAMLSRQIPVRFLDGLIIQSSA